jgi:EAL domain-containing protein (putative c-di-GMP-specific phosphodiesterase class I)
MAARGLITGLRRAIDRHEFVVHYQPIVDLRDGSLLGSEALVRWQRPGGDLVPPDEFIGAAEQAGLIADIGAAVLDQVTHDLGRRLHTSTTTFSVSVNVSASELDEPTWADRVLVAGQELARSGIELEIELTETAVMQDPEHACIVLEKVRAGGVRVVLDDFGTGFSTISWLHRLPVDALKVDRSFVTNLASDPDCARIVAVTISLAHELGLSITAEGIEDRAERDLLTELGCHRGQGFLFARPIPIDELMHRRSSAG